MYYLFSYLISRQDSQGDQSLTDGTSLKYKNYLSRPEAQSRVQLFTMSMTTHSQPLPTREKGGSGVLNDFFLSQLLDQRARIRLQNVIEHEI